MKIGKRGEPKRRFAWVLHGFYHFFGVLKTMSKGDHMRLHVFSCLDRWTNHPVYGISNVPWRPGPCFKCRGHETNSVCCWSAVTAEGKWSASGYAGYGCSWLEAMMMSFLALLRLTHTHIHSKITSCFDKLKQKRTETVPSFFRPVDSLSTPTGSLRLCRGRVVCPKTKSPRP